MQPIFVHRLRFRSYDHLFVTNTANSPCGPNIDHQLKRFAPSVTLCYPLQQKHPVFTTRYLRNDAVRCSRNILCLQLATYVTMLFVVTETSPLTVKESRTDKMLKTYLLNTCAFSTLILGTKVPQ
jgi:hypothetical protein